MAPHHHLKESQTIKLIMAERDKAIQERDLALYEKKTALAERDRAYLQRDAAIAERNSAIVERDSAVAAHKYAHENDMSDYCGPACPCSHHDNKHMYQQQQHIQSVHPSSRHLADVFPLRAVPVPAASQTGMKTKRARKELKVQPSPSNKLKEPRKSRRSGADTLRNTVARTAGDWRGALGIGANLTKQVPVKKHHGWKSPDLGLNEVAFDESTMPAPVCSCTGKYHQCYRWGSGGWQSSCCTTTLSMHPLPVMPDKRHARVGGRKMSGTVFRKLLSKLAAEGHDLSLPVDLREHWAKHGTNGYITIR